MKNVLCGIQIAVCAVALLTVQGCFWHTHTEKVIVPEGTSTTVVAPTPSSTSTTTTTSTP